MSHIHDEVGTTVDSRFKPLVEALLQWVDKRLNDLKSPSTLSEEKEMEESEQRESIRRGKQQVGETSNRKDHSVHSSNSPLRLSRNIPERLKYQYYDYEDEDLAEEQYERRRRRNRGQ